MGFLFCKHSWSLVNSVSRVRSSWLLCTCFRGIPGWWFFWNIPLGLISVKPTYTWPHWRGQASTWRGFQFWVRLSLGWWGPDVASTELQGRVDCTQLLQSHKESIWELKKATGNSGGWKASGEMTATYWSSALKGAKWNLLQQWLELASPLCPTSPWEHQKKRMDEKQYLLAVKCSKVEPGAWLINYEQISTLSEDPTLVPSNYTRQLVYNSLSPQLQGILHL